LTRASLMCDVEAGSGGSGVARSTASTKNWLGGETRNGLHLCGL
jgi:hypothetical protein